jgi:hypothetical protein
MDLETLSYVSQIVGTLTIVGGMIFALVPLSEARKQRQEARTAELMRTFMDPHLADAITLVRRLPDGVSAEQLRAAGPEAEKAAVRICMSFETMGLLVYRRIAPFDLVFELAGGITVMLWHKLGPWLEQIRIEQAQPSWAEWFQWLAQQCATRKEQKAAPAHVRHANWHP